MQFRYDGDPMRARIAIVLAIMLGANAARAQAPATGEPLQAAPVPIEAAPTAAPDPGTVSPAPEAPAGEPLVESGSSGASIPADTAAVSGEMTEAELQAFGLGTNEAAVDTSVHLSGFIDFGMESALDQEAEIIAKRA